MILKDNNSNQLTTLRGFNNTIDNIKKQMETAKDPWKQKENASTKELEASKEKFDPQKQKETMIKMSKLNGGSR